MTATPEPVSPAPDTWDLRHRLAARLARLDAEQWGGDHDFAPYGKDRESDSVVDAAAKVFEAVQAEREAGLRADLDQARRERDEAQRQEVAWRASAQESDKGLTLYAREVRRLRAELAGARPIPDDAAERLKKFVTDLQAAEAPGEPDRSESAAAYDDGFRDATVQAGNDLEMLLADLGATPTTDPAPAEAGRPRWVQRGLHHHRCAVRAGAADCTCGVEPAAPQAPAEPTSTPDGQPDMLVPSRESLPPSAATYALDEESTAQRNAALAGLAPREDAATPPLPLHEQADLLTWRVVHVPPGTTDREDTDTPITPGWWLVGHGDDPDHPDVQVHLGDRLPTSSAATPGDEYNDDLGGRVRPTPIQPEEA